MAKVYRTICQLHSALVAAGLIIDSGANQHLTYTDKDLVDVIDISNLGITVSHPNRTKACITKVGNMVLNKNLTLYDVLVILEYCMSLMSVHKVARDSKLIVAFDESKCYVLPQDLRDIKMLGIDFCEICQKAKQTRELFPLSDQKSTMLGELVHIDLCGPYKVTSKEEFKYFLTLVDDYTRAVWVYLIKTKDENGIVERKHRHLLNVCMITSVLEGITFDVMV
ncbi:ribonuclease H-like domain-containing protein [Tanacetum coccineum]